MKKIFERLTQKQFRYLAILLCFWGDLLVCRYIYLKFSTKFPMFKEMLAQTLAQKGFSIANVDQAFIWQQFQIMQQVIVIMLILVIFFHLIIYLLFLRKKIMPEKYIKVIAALATPGCLLLGIFSLTTLPFYSLLLLVQSPLYLFVLLGLRHQRLNLP